MSRIRDLCIIIRRCDPGHYLTREETYEVLRHLSELEREELSDSNGHLGWLYMKIKANADHHGLSFQIPGRWAHLYDAYRADLQIYRLSEPFRTIAIYLRNFRLRRSFMQGEGSGPKYQL